MDDLQNRIKVEIENIDEIFNELPHYSKLPKLTTLELAGVAALLHNYYNGIENIIKQILIGRNIQIPEGKSWHKEILEISVKERIISEDCKVNLGRYLAFRHFFMHTYALDLYAGKMEPLVEKSKEIYLSFKTEIKKYL